MNELTDQRWNTIVSRFVDNLASGEYTISECLCLFIDDYGYTEEETKFPTGEDPYQYIERRLKSVWSSISTINQTLYNLEKNKADKPPALTTSNTPAEWGFGSGGVNSYSYTMAVDGCDTSTITISDIPVNSATANVGGGGTYNFGGISTKWPQ